MEVTMEEAFANEWPGAARHWRFAAGKGRGSRRSRKIDDLERLVAISHAARGGPVIPPFGGGRGRRRRGDVRTALLLLLAEEPRNGYQLMQEIEQRSGGNWRPSPGSVYPILAQLEDEGLIRAVDRDGTRLFEITDQGRAQVADREDPTPPWESEDDVVPVGDLKSQIKALNIAAGQLLHVGNEGQVQKAVETLTEARRSLYRILAEDDDS
jgi:DNA-binding PadR family transcriptional regulator